MREKLTVLIVNIIKEMKQIENLDPDESLFVGGILDSFDLLHLIPMIEKRCNVLIDGQDVIPENFFNVNAIAILVERLQCKNLSFSGNKKEKKE
ncbi:MAG: acyl carrier protein [Maribacter sp.]|nr:acyl carrier protein [Candidatus Brocadiaceae bacterium]MCP4978492.1 acyl carrier protein [Maribacter sp.]